MPKVFVSRRRVKFNWGLAAALLLALAAVPLLLTRTRHKLHVQHVQPIASPSSEQALQRHVQSLLHKCPLPGYCVRNEGLPESSAYLRSSGPGHPGMQRQHAMVAQYLNSSSFQERLQQLHELPGRHGILISAGKPHHVGNTVVMLHVLRHHLNCSLPVEVAHRGESEVDNITRATLAAAFPPLHWLDLDTQPYPQHHNKDYTMDRYEPKIYALYHTRLQQVLMLDADNLPLKDPTYLFTSPHMIRHGVMAWLDLWSPELSSTTFVGWDSVYPLVGLNKEPYLTALTGGQGHVRRVAESGQLLLDRVRHADVLEWLWMYTSFSRDLYHHILGDKDTFGFAFAAASKLHELHAIALPPGVALRYELVGPAWKQRGKWHFNGMMQYDHLGDQVFFHRTLEKWQDVRHMPPIMDVITGPVPNWFIYSFLGDSTSGFNPDLPEHALQPLTPPVCPSNAQLTTFVLNNSYTLAMQLTLGGGQPGSSCSSGFLLRFLELRHLGLPLTLPAVLERPCRESMLLLRDGRGAAAPGTTGVSVAAQAAPTSAAAATAAKAGKQQEDGVDAFLMRDEMRGSVGHRRMHAGAASQVEAAMGVGGGIRRQHKLLVDRGGQHHQLQQQQQQEATLHQGGSMQEAAAEFFTELGEDAWLGECQHNWQQARGTSYVARAGDNGPAAGPGRAGTAGSEHWPSCESVSWHTARFLLPEYAEQVGRGPDGHPVKAPAAVLPVLRLNSAPRGSTTAGCCSSMDAVQQWALPAAVQWVNENLDRLPYLKQ